MNIFGFLRFETEDYRCDFCLLIVYFYIKFEFVRFSLSVFWETDHSLPQAKRSIDRAGGMFVCTRIAVSSVTEFGRYM